MSALGHLNERASRAVLSEDERSSINKSIATLVTRLDNYFKTEGDGLQSHFRFGSSVRGTILPRSLDDRSDIDYMVVFEKSGFTPQTYLDRLKRFAELRYGTSEIYQSSPTVVLELDHIKFDLVPALRNWGSSYQIPLKNDAWQVTNPNEFSQHLEQKNAAENYLIKPTIRLAKIWNASNDYVFDSFAFEKWICGINFFSCSNQQSYLFRIFDCFAANTQTQWRNERIARAKAIIENVRQYERLGYFQSAENELKKLIP